MRRHLKQLKMPAAALWRSPRQLITHQPPPAAARWLHDLGSVTQNLLDRYGPVTVDLLEQSWGHPSLNESRSLGIGSRRLAIVRRVALIAGGQRRVLARTIMPEASLLGRFRKLGRIGNRPLGHLLFTDPGIHRVGCQIALLPADHPLFPELDCTAWGRRSWFALSDGLILVYEVFLPSLFHAVIESNTVTKEAA